MPHKTPNFAQAKPKRAEAEHCFLYFVPGGDPEQDSPFRNARLKTQSRLVNPRDSGDLAMWEEDCRQTVVESVGTEPTPLGVYMHRDDGKVVVVG